MMIHINLLPVRQEKKREVGRQFLVVVGGAVFITLLGNWLWYDGLASEEKKNAQRMAATQARIAELEKVIGEVDKINARKKDVQAKLAILADLRKQRSGPVRMLDALSTAIPKKVWLTSFEERSNEVRMVGRAARTGPSHRAETGCDHRPCRAGGRRGCGRRIPHVLDLQLLHPRGPQAGG